MLKDRNVSHLRPQRDNRHQRDAGGCGARGSGGEIEGRPISRRSEFSYQRRENGPRSIKLPFIKEPNKSMALKRLGVTLVRVNLAFINPFRK